MAEFDSGGEPVRKRHSADLPGGYCGNCGGHSHRTDNCPNKKNIEVPTTTCSCHPSPTSPDPLASIAESLEKLANPLLAVNGDNPYQHLSREDCVAILLATRSNQESEKFFRHLNNGEVELKDVYEMCDDPDDGYRQTGYRITITEKGLPA